MSWEKSTIGGVLVIIKNGLNCDQNKSNVGDKITRIETIAKHTINLNRVGFAELTESEKIKNRLKKGDILFSHINSPIHVGKSAIYEGEEPLYHGVNLLLLRTIENVNPYFFNFYLNYIFSTGYWEHNCKKSVNQASVNQKDISKVPFDYPTLTIQEKLVTKLDTIFAEIDKATAAAEANIKNAEALFQSYLTEVFERGSGGTSDYHLGDICKIVGGGTPSKSNQKFYDGDIPWATVRDMGEDIIKATDFKITADAVRQSSTNIIPKNNVVIATRVGLGKVCIIENDTAINQDLRGIIPFSNDLVRVEYLFYWFKSISKVIVEAGRGATVQGVTLPFVKNLKIRLPSIKHQQEIIFNIYEIQKNLKFLTDSTNKKISNLNCLKQSILQQAFNGELIKE